MKILLKLNIIWLIMLGIAYVTIAQCDTTRTPIGYDIDQPFIYVRFDTIHNMAQVYSYYHHKVFISVNGGRALEVQRGGVLTVWSNHFKLTVTRKKYRHIYQF